MNIQTRYEGKRGCGYRKPGGLYLVSGDLFKGCGKLPIPLTVCPCCHAGIKPARGWTWVGSQLIEDAPCKINGCKGCPPFDGSVRRFGLIWVGEKFYSTPAAFMNEGLSQGISRRLSAIPKEFEIDKTWVLLAHRKAVPTYTVSYEGSEVIMNPGIFCAFKPTAIEYVVKDDDDDEKLERLEKKGITLVRVKPEQTEIELYNQ